MRKVVIALSFAAMLSQPLAVLAEDQVTTVEKTSVQSENTYSNPLTEVVIFPVRLVTGVIGAPIGAVGGLFTGFVKGFNWPGGTKTTQKAQRTTTTTAD